MEAPFRDVAAAERLMAEVERRYREHSGKRFTKFALFKATGIGRTTLDNWLEIGVMPEPGGLAKVATAIGTEPAVLWLRWLGLEPPDAGLDKIAHEISELRRTLAAAGASPKQTQDALVAITAAREDPGAAPEDAPPSEPGASVRLGTPAEETPRR